MSKRKKWNAPEARHELIAMAACDDALNTLETPEEKARVIGWLAEVHGLEFQGEHTHTERHSHRETTFFVPPGLGATTFQFNTPARSANAEQLLTAPPAQDADYEAIEQTHDLGDPGA